MERPDAPTPYVRRDAPSDPAEPNPVEPDEPIEPDRPGEHDGRPEEIIDADDTGILDNQRARVNTEIDEALEADREVDPPR